MNHLIICREYPPASGGGIATYTAHLARLLASHGETVHIIGQQWHGAQHSVECQFNGRLLIHRLPYNNWAVPAGQLAHPTLQAQPARDLFYSNYPPQSFAYQAAILAEQLVEARGIDIIEAPEYEAPLYFFLLRRALGLGPQRHPPCIVHLHSPTRLIAQHNDWPLAEPAIQTALQLEEYTVSAADALLCPNEALAAEAVQLFGRPRADISIIPLPLGPDQGRLIRNPATWSQGTVCYVGRLERRKGLLEWLVAAIEVAQENATVRFEFAGNNILGKDPINSNAVLERIPRELRSRFRFLGELHPMDLTGVLQRARMAVVPSRWENFPYVCVEAMQSGLPVLATRCGALPTMIADGRSGWLADEPTPTCLAQTLRRALACTPDELEASGTQAAETIRVLCDNERILQQHLTLRKSLAGRTASFSMQLPAALPVMHESRITRHPRRRAKPSDPSLVTVDVSEDANAVRAAILAALDQSPRPSGLVLYLRHDKLHQDLMTTGAQVLTNCPEVGLVAGWTRGSGGHGRLGASPCPAFPFQWLNNAAALPLLVRTEALLEAGGLPVGSPALAVWELANAILASGWVGVTYPSTWATYMAGDPAKPASPLRADEPLPARLGGRFAQLIELDAAVIERLSPYLEDASLPAGAGSRPTWMALMRIFVRQPRVMGWFALWLVRRLARSASWALPMWLALARDRWLTAPAKIRCLPAGNYE